MTRTGRDMNTLASPTSRRAAMAHRSRPLAARAALLACCYLLISLTASAQNIQFTQGAVGSGLDNSIQIPVASYPGRGSASLPVTLYYSSRVWRIGNFDTYMINGARQTAAEAIYSEFSSAGWTTSLDLPIIEWPKPNDQYNSDGQPSCSICQNGAGWRIARVFIHMPDGSTHELRKQDDAYYSPNSIDMSGIFYAVDGSRLRYDGTDQTTGTLYLPDGSHYDLSASESKFTDRNGNTLIYNSSSRQWSDTMGRTIALPWAASPLAQEYDYVPPGFQTTSPYKFIWKHLSDAGVLLPGYTRKAVATQYLPDLSQPPNGTTNAPQQNSLSALFHADTPDSDLGDTPVVGRGQAGGQLFDPVVLAEVDLPNNLSYKFYYDEFGEVAKVVYPTGGYEQYTLSQVDPASELLPPYTQGNRGVTQRLISAKGDGSDLVPWNYSAVRVWDSVSVASNGNLIVTTIAPNNTRTESYRRILRPAPFGHDNSIYWPFDYTDPTSGMPYDERIYAPNPDGSKGPMLRRSLIRYVVSSETIAQRAPIFQGQRVVTAYRNARPDKAVSLILDTGGDALAKKVTYSYDTTFEMTTGLDRTGMSETLFASVDQTTAQGGTIDAISNNYTYPAAGSTVTTYLNDQSYHDRNILGLVTSVVLDDASGNPVSKTETFYDESGLAILAPYNDLGMDANYVDPATSLRGNPTTVRHYVAASASVTQGQACPAGVCLETHAQFDQYGNPVYFWDERAVSPFTSVNAASKKDYSASYRHAYLTQTTSIAPDPSGQHGSSAAFTTSSTYDAVTGHVLTATDANGQATSFSYQDNANPNVTDPMNRLRKVTRPDGGWTKTDYNDVVGNLYVHTESALDASRSTHAYQFYDGLGRAVHALASEIGSNFIGSDTIYDSMGRVSQVSNPYRTQTFDGASHASYWTTTAYDALGRVIQVTLPDSTVVTTSYTGGVYTTVTDQAGRQRRQKVDALGRVVRVDEPDATGNLGATSAPAQPSFYEYDTMGNVVRINQGLTSQGANPEVASSYVQHRYFKYDALSRLTYEKQAEQAGTITTAADPLTGNTTWSRHLTYDIDTDPNNTVSYPGLLVRAEDARHVVTHFYYDQLSRNYQVSYSDGTPTVTNKYDQARTDAPPTGQQAVTFYNKGRVTEVDTAATASVPQTQQTYDYDLMGRDVRQQQVVDVTTYQMRYAYNLGGGMTSETYPSGRVVTYGYDSAARLSSVASGATTYASAMTYKPFGGLESMSLGNGTTYSMSYSDTRLQLSSISLTQGATTVQRYDYKYGQVNMADGTVDPAKDDGQIVEIEGTIGAQRQWQQRFSYDSLGRLSSAGEYRGDTLQQSYLLNYDYLDPFGNRYQQSSRNANNPFPQSWAEAGAYDQTTNRFNANVTYDDAGNVTADARFRNRAFQYDANNRQKQSSNLDGSAAVQSVYDGAGHRVAVKAGGQLTNVMVYDAAGDLVAEYGGSVSNNGTQYVMGDHQGSTRVVMNSTQVSGDIVASRHDYLPFGEDYLGAGVGMRTAGQKYDQADSVRQKYAGMEGDDATGMSHTLWREYDTLSARWTAPDPYSGSMSLTNPQSFNRYSYVNNDPVNKVDPAGLMAGAEQGWGGFEGFGGESGFYDSHFGGPGIIENGWNGFPDRPDYEDNYILDGVMNGTDVIPLPDSSGNVSDDQSGQSTQSAPSITFEIVPSGPLPDDHLAHPQMPNLKSVGTQQNNAGGAFYAILIKVNFPDGANIKDYSNLRTAIILTGTSDGSSPLRQGQNENPDRDQRVVKGNSRYVIDTPGIPLYLIQQGATKYGVIFVTGEYNNKSHQIEATFLYGLSLDVRNPKNSFVKSISSEEFIQYASRVINVPKKGGQPCIACLLQK